MFYYICHWGLMDTSVPLDQTVYRVVDSTEIPGDREAVKTFFKHIHFLMILND